MHDGTNVKVMELLKFRKLHFSIGTCESFFAFESRIESAIRFDFESNFRIESAVYTTQAVTPSNELHRYLFCICHERE